MSSNIDIHFKHSQTGEYLKVQLDNNNYTIHQFCIYAREKINDYYHLNHQYFIVPTGTIYDEMNIPLNENSQQNMLEYIQLHQNNVFYVREINNNDNNNDNDLYNHIIFNNHISDIDYINYINNNIGNSISAYINNNIENPINSAVNVDVNVENGSRCNICFLEYSNNNINFPYISCGHNNYCNDCLIVWRQSCIQNGQHYTCPECRSIISESSQQSFIRQQNYVTH